MKAAIVFDDNLNPGLLANASACIISGLFHGEENLVGPKVDGDFFSYIPITKIPILVVHRKEKPWKELLNRAKKNKLKYMIFTREAQSTTKYEEYMERVEGKPIEDVDVLGIGVLGEGSGVQKFSGDLPLLK